MLVHMGNNNIVDEYLFSYIYLDMYCCFQKWRKELAKNREKLLGASDKDKEKEKKMTDKDKEEKKEKKEVCCLSFSRHLSCLTLNSHLYSFWLFILCLEKEEREEEIQQGEERPPVFGWPAVPQY